MLERTDKKLQSYFAHEPQLGAGGKTLEMDRVTQINRQQCECMGELHEKLRPDVSVETGLAYGFSTIPILDSMERNNYGHHFSIDPGQMHYWHGVALASIEQLEFTKRFTWIEARSDRGLTKLIEEGKRAQFVFFDGLHRFETILTDFCLADQILDVGGLLIINDMWMPAVRSVASYLSNNIEHYEVYPSPHDNIFTLTKKREDSRDWDHFVPFDGAGIDKNEKPKGFFQKLRGR